MREQSGYVMRGPELVVKTTVSPTGFDTGRARTFGVAFLENLSICDIMDLEVEG